MTRVERFTNSFFSEKDAFDACLITSKNNRYYLTGFSSSDGIIVLTNEKPYLIVDFRYYEMAKVKVQPPFEIILAEGGFSDTVKKVLSKHNIKSLWIEDYEMSVAELDIYKKRFPKLSFFNIGTALSDFRAIKDADEIEFIKNAQKITDNAFLHILNFINKERTENEIALELEFYMRTNGADGIAFDTICVSGTKSSLPHGTPSDIKISENSFLTMDFGARFNGYCSDMTRTIVVGNASDKMLDVYFTVLKAQQLALDNITAGVLGCDVDRAARDYIYSHGYEGCFGHSTGHGLGIDVHEAPSFSPNYKKPIPNGAILSVEPGIYIEGKFGVRIEDIVIVKVDGYENLTKSQKQLIQI